MDTNNKTEKKFRLLPGLLGLFVGFVIYFLLSVVFGVEQGVTGRQHGGFLLALSFGVMVLPPLWYWILRILYVTGKVKNKKWLKILPVAVWWITLLILIFAGLSIS